MFMVKTASPDVRHILSTQMHKVAARMAPFPIARDEITIKEAAQLVGTQMFHNWLTKRAMVQGIINTVRISRGV